MANSKSMRRQGENRGDEVDNGAETGRKRSGRTRKLGLLDMTI